MLSQCAFYSDASYLEEFEHKELGKLDIVVRASRISLSIINLFSSYFLLLYITTILSVRLLFIGFYQEGINIHFFRIILIDFRAREIATFLRRISEIFATFINHTVKKDS